MRTRILLLLFCLVLAVGVIVTLFLRSVHPNKQPGNFARLVPPHSLSYVKDIQLAASDYYFVGQSANRLYICRQQSPNKIVELDSGLNEQGQHTLRIPGLNFLYSVQTQVDFSRQAFVLDGQKPVIFQANLPDSNLIPHPMYKHFFSKAVSMGQGRWVLLRYDGLLKQNVLERYDLDTNLIQDIKRYVPERTGDGIFSVDGLLAFDPGSRSLLYVYFYRNQMLCLDTNLRVKWQASTIDSFRQPQMELSQVNGKTVMIKKPILVNKSCCIDGNRLYIQSGVLANNDPADLVQRAAVIDVYDLQNGRYLQSLYAYHFRERPLTGFRVMGDAFMGIYGSYLARFTIRRIRSEQGSARRRH